MVLGAAVYVCYDALTTLPDHFLVLYKTLSVYQQAKRPIKPFYCLPVIWMQGACVTFSQANQDTCFGVDNEFIMSLFKKKKNLQN